jgi:hypothetical protein
MVDQVLSSLSNLILSVLVARKLNANAYGTPGAWENVGRVQAQFAG